LKKRLDQKTEDGKSIAQAAWQQNIVPGIKVDKGKIRWHYRTAT